MNGAIHYFNLSKARLTRQPDEAIMSVDTSKGHEAMDYPEHERTYAGFIKATTWGTAAIIVLLIVMAVTLL
jgi:hypothetical protein